MADGQGAVHWTSAGQSVTYSHGAGMDVETTALAAMALMKAGLWPESVKQALSWLSHEKSSCGTWGSTQATILAMRALLAGSAASFGQEFDSAITLLLNGEAIETFHINKENSDVMRQVDPDAAPSAPGKTTSNSGRSPSGSCLFSSRAPIGFPRFGPSNRQRLLGRRHPNRCKSKSNMTARRCP